MNKFIDRLPLLCDGKWNQDSMTFTIKPIITEEDFKTSMAEFERLFDLPKKTDDDYNQIELLGANIEAYEKKHWLINPPNPVAAMEFAMESRGIQSDDN